MIATPREKADERFAVFDFAAADLVIQVALGEPARLYALVVHPLGVALRESGSEEDVHLLFEKAGARPVSRQLLPLARAQTGLFAEFAFGGTQRRLAGVNAASAKLPELAAGGQAELDRRAHV